MGEHKQALTLALVLGGTIAILRALDEIKGIIVSRQDYPLHCEKVIAGPEPDCFYQRGKERVYQSIDGIPIEQYVSTVYRR